MKLVRLLRKLTGVDRRAIFTERLSQSQRLELEAFMSSLPKEQPVPEKRGDLSSEEDEALAIEDLEDAEDVDFKDVKSRGRSPRASGQGITAKAQNYDAYVSVEWIHVKCRGLKTLEEAIDTHILLTEVAERVRNDQTSSMKDRLLQAIDVTSKEHGIHVDKAKIALRIQVPSSHWTGRGLMTPVFPISEIDAFAQFWLKLREARGHSSGKVKIGGKGMAFRMTPAEMDEMWSRVREVYLDLRAQRGQNREEVARRLDAVVAQRAPFRKRIWRAWNQAMMQRAERQQRAYESRQKRKLEQLERRRMAREDRWARSSWRELEKVRGRVEALLLQWSRSHKGAKWVAKAATGRRVQTRTRLTGKNNKAYRHDAEEYIFQIIQV